MAQFEQLAFASKRLFDIGIVHPAGKLGRHRHRVGAIAFGGKPRLARVELDQPFADDRQIGPRHGFVEATEDIASFDVIAVARK